MKQQILDHYLQFGLFTNPGCYKEFLQKLPDDIHELGELISHQIIHRITLKEGNTNANHDLRYGDMDKFPWYRLRCEDDVLPNAISMIAELLRLDDVGFHKDRKIEHKIVVTCRYVAILMAAILKSKGIPARVRSGFAPYFHDYSTDHWINQYWSKEENRWMTIDADGFFDFLDFDQYDIPQEKFDWAADTYLGIRKGKLDGDHFHNGGGFTGLMPVMWAVFYDFHSLMNNEILYMQAPHYIGPSKFDKLSETDFAEIDELAKLLLDPDKNFAELVSIWENKKKFRILNSPLIGESDHVKWK